MLSAVLASKQDYNRNVLMSNKRGRTYGWGNILTPDDVLAARADEDICCDMKASRCTHVRVDVCLYWGIINLPDKN